MKHGKKFQKSRVTEEEKLSAANKSPRSRVVFAL